MTTICPNDGVVKESPSHVRWSSEPVEYTGYPIPIKITDTGNKTEQKVWNFFHFKSCCQECLPVRHASIV